MELALSIWASSVFPASFSGGDFSATSTTWTYAGPEIQKFVESIFSDDLSEFTDTPGPIELGSNPTRDETTHNGVWDNELLPLVQNMEAVESASGTFPDASIADPYENMGQHDEPTMDEVPPTANQAAFPPSSGVDGGRYHCVHERIDNRNNQWHD